jgi:hypothetical protein
MFPCIFCDLAFPSCERLAIHLVEVHPKTSVDIEGERKVFALTKATAFFVQRIRCICDERFTTFDIKAVAPHFRPGKTLEEAAVGKTTTNSFIAHLRREGGLAAHLAKLRDAAMLDKVASAGREGDVFARNDRRFRKRYKGTWR